MVGTCSFNFPNGQFGCPAVVLNRIENQENPKLFLKKDNKESIHGYLFDHQPDLDFRLAIR